MRWLECERGRLIRAALTLIQNWIVRGRPAGTERLGSFEAWAEVMGGILDAAGVKGFLGNLDSLHDAADEEGSLWREFVGMWWAAHRDQPMRAADLAHLCRTADLMTPVLGDASERSQSTRLAAALKGARDRIVGDYQVSLVRDVHAKQNLYRLVQHDPR